MGALRKLAAAALGCTALTGVAPAQAATGAQAAQLAKSTFHGPGSPGFLPSCSGNFLLQNVLYLSNSFIANSPGWSGANAGASNPTVTNGGTITSGTGTGGTDIGPDGQADATDVTIAAVPNSTADYSVLTQTTSSSAFAQYYAYTFQIWVKDTTGPGTGNAFISLRTSAGVYHSAAIPNDGQWHLVTVYTPPGPSGVNTLTVQIGVDRRDTANQTSAISPSATQPKTLVIADAMAQQGYSEGGKGWPYIANNTTTFQSTPTQVNLQCPSTVAFRDFSQLKPWLAANPSDPRYRSGPGVTNIVTFDQSKAYQYAGIGNPFFSQPAMTSGTYAGSYVGFASTTDGTVSGASGNHNDWFTTVLLYGPNIFNIKEASPGTPQIQVPGSTYQNGGVASGGGAPCLSGCSTANTISGLSYNSTTGVVTLTLAASATFPTGASLVVSGLTGTGSIASLACAASSPCQALSVSGATVTYQAAKSLTLTYTSGGTATPSAPMNSYTLHSWWIPGGCTVPTGGTVYTYCMLVNANNGIDGNGGNGVFLAYSNSVDTGWCLYTAAASTPANCTNGASTIPGGVATTVQPTAVMSTSESGAAANLPTLLQVGSTNYVFTPGASATHYSFQMWTGAVGDGLNWTLAGSVTIGNTTSGEWDAGKSRIDPGLYKNRCGFYELYYTMYGGTWQPPTGASRNQGIGLFVASDIRGPWYHLNSAPFAPLGDGSGHTTGQTGAIIPFSSPLYNSAVSIGESVVFDQNGWFYWTGNADNGSNASYGVGAYMKDACP